MANNTYAMVMSGKSDSNIRNCYTAFGQQGESISSETSKNAI